MAHNPDPLFWRNKRVLVTGHTGFKGAWLCIWLHRLGAQITGLSLAPNTDPNLFETIKLEQDISHFIGDIRDAGVVENVFDAAQPEIIFHLAAQPLVRPSYQDPVSTFSTNVMGTAHVLDCARRYATARTCVVATTDKVYLNLDAQTPFKEEDALGGHDPYSASKSAAEMILQSYRKSYFNEAGIGLVAARAGNVIAGGDWAEDRLIPDAVRAWQKGETLHVRMPDAVRPWQYVLEPLLGYIKLAEVSYDGPGKVEAINLGPDEGDIVPVKILIEQARSAFGTGEVEFAPRHDGPHEASFLALDNQKSKSVLSLLPRFDIERAVLATMDWYRRFYAGDDARQICFDALDQFEGTHAI